MIQGKNIICVGFPSWEGDYMKAIVQILSVLAQKNRVLYIDYQHTYKDLAMSVVGKNKAPLKRMLGLAKRCRTIRLANQTEVKVLTLPPVFPINWLPANKLYHWLLGWNSRQIRHSIQKTAEKLEMHNPLVINAFNPTYGIPLINRLEERLLLYYCYDEISHAEWCKKHGARMEAAFAPQADAVIATSEPLQTSKRRYNDQCFLVKNGVNVALFQQALGQRSQYQIKDKPQVVGYLGTVDDRLDYELLEFCIQKAPNLQFYFVGRVTYPSGKARLSAYDNVHFLGAKSPEQLPKQVAQFDVGIIPFVRNGFTENIYPLKINEYLAAGLPVVTTNFGQLADFQEIVTIASQSQDFLQALLLETHYPECDDEKQANIQKRVAFAQANSWESRAEELSQIIEEVIEQKKEEFLVHSP
ncbi:MAG TPA: teichuronic acid biosynthesis glycosyltransferase tuaH [Microscillaceae bacterium]|nr:teichuronic acid biosynthesis glycosyltransferase tuaH [Microscillaceae bacterium]